MKTMNRRLLSGFFGIGLFIFCVAECQREPSGVSIFFFVCYFLTGCLLLLQRSPSPWAILSGLLNGAALLCLHWTVPSGSAVWMLYWSSGTALARCLRSVRQMMAVLLLFGAGFSILELCRMNSEAWSESTLITTVLWSVLLMLLLHEGWWQKKRQSELERRYAGLKRRAEVLQENTRWFIQKADEWAHRDSLTGLYNFKGFQLKLRQMWRSRSPFVVLLLDVVSFSEMNASMGRDAGDKMLRHIADMLTKEMPDDAILSRYVGDKFAAAFTFEEKSEVEKTIRSLTERLMHPQPYPLRYCAGMAIYPQDGQTMEDIINVAEKRLANMQRVLNFNVEHMRQHKQQISNLKQLAAALAHEIRNPLTSVRGFVQLASRQAEALQRWKDIILSEIDRIDALLAWLLDVADQQQRPQLVCLNDAIQKASASLHLQAVTKGCRLKTVLPSHPIYAWVKERQFQQVLEQLIQYGLAAVEGAEDGVVEVVLVEQAETVILIVRDNGFLNMRDDEMKWKKKGDVLNAEDFASLKNDLYGLGFSLIRQVVADYGGNLTVQPLSWGGKEVVLFLPRGDVAQEMPLVASAGGELVE